MIIAGAIFGQGGDFREFPVAHLAYIGDAILIEAAAELVAVEIAESVAGADGSVLNEIVGISTVGIVAGKAGGFLPVRAIDLVYNAVLQGGEHVRARIGEKCGAVVYQVA